MSDQSFVPDSGSWASDLEASEEFESLVNQAELAHYNEDDEEEEMPDDTPRDDTAAEKFGGIDAALSQTLSSASAFDTIEEGIADLLKRGKRSGIFSPRLYAKWTNADPFVGHRMISGTKEGVIRRNLEVRTENLYRHFEQGNGAPYACKPRIRCNLLYLHAPDDPSEDEDEDVMEDALDSDKGSMTSGEYVKPLN